MRPRILALYCLLLLIPANGSAGFAYVPDTETKWTLAFEEISEFQLESMLQTIDGTELNLPSPEMSARITRNIEVTDLGMELESGRMLKRRRTFETIRSDVELSLAISGNEQFFELSYDSELAEEPLLITRDANSARHKFEYRDEDAPDPKLLDDLIEDLDYRQLVPPEDAEEGDSWVLDLEGSSWLFSPGGQLHLYAEEAPEVNGDVIEAYDIVALANLSAAEASRNVSGQLNAVWTETVKQDGARIAVVKLELEAVFESDLAEAIETMTSSLYMEPRKNYHHESTWEVEGRGELRWDLDAGHFRSLELELEAVVEISLGYSQKFGEIVVEVESSGTTKLSAKASR